MDLGEVFREGIDGYWPFEEADKIIMQNGVGNIWLTGGFLYRTIVELLYDVDMPEETDFDFIVEKRKKMFILPYQCTSGRNSYGNPKFTYGDISIDLIPLNNIHSIKRRGLEPSIENYLTGVPLTIQSIAFDINTGDLIGDVGMNAIETRTVEVNDKEQLAYYSKRKRIPGKEIIKRKKKSLGFI